MSRKLSSLECGSLPEELHKALENGYSVYLTPCHKCGKTLISMKNSSIQSPGEVKIYAFFKCECGARFKRVALELPGAKDGYSCAQGLIKKLIKPRRAAVRGKAIKNEVVAYAIDFYFNGQKKRYIVSKDTITLKTPKEQIDAE